MAKRPNLPLLCRTSLFVLIGGGFCALYGPPQAKAATAVTEEAEALGEEAQPQDADADAAAATDAAPANAEPQTAGAPPTAEGGDALDDAQAEVDSRHTVGEQPELTVLPIHNAAGRAFDLAVGRHLMEGLVNVTHLTPLPATRAMVAKMHPRPQDLHLPKTLTTLGRRLHVPYVLVVEAVGKARPTHVFIGLVEVRTGTTLLAYRASMPRGVLTPELGLDLAARVRSALRHPAQLRRAAQARDEINAAKQGRGKAGPDAAEPEDGADADVAPEQPAEPQAKTSGRGKKRGADKDADTEAPSEVKTYDDGELSRAMLDRARGWLRLQIPQRVSRLNVADVDGATAPCYCGTNGKSNPFFAMFAFGGEAYTSLFTGQRRRLQDNFGLRFNVGIAPVRSYVKGDSATTIRSTVVQLDADALFRFIWLPHRSLSPDATVGVGVAYYAFPLKNAAYPGVVYLAPDFRLDLNFPLHNAVGLFGSVAVRPAMAVGGDARQVLGTPGKGVGLMLGAGVRGHWNVFEAEVKFHLESYGANFKGPTKLANTPNGTSSGKPVQFNNTKLRDSLKEIIVQVGVAL